METPIDELVVTRPSVHDFFQNAVIKQQIDSETSPRGSGNFSRPTAFQSHLGSAGPAKLSTPLGNDDEADFPSYASNSVQKTATGFARTSR